MGHWMSFGLYLSFFRMPNQIHSRSRRINGQYRNKGYYYRCAISTVQRFCDCGTRHDKQGLGSLGPVQSVCVELGTMDERAVASFAQHLAEQTHSYPCAILLRTHQAGRSTEDCRSGDPSYPLAELQNGVWWYSVRGLCGADDCDCIPRLAKKKITFLIIKEQFS